MERLTGLVDSITANPYIAAGIIVAIAFVAAGVVDFIVTRICRLLARRTKSNFDDELVGILHNPVRTTVFLFGLGVAVDYLDLGALERFVLVTLRVIVLFVWTGFAFRFVGLAVRVMAEAPKVTIVAPRTEPLFTNVGRLLVLSGMIYYFFLIIGVQPTAWLASAGVVGLAVGFAAKDTLANLFAGIFIMADAPYKLGDMINLDSGDRGQVTHIGLRSTRLLTRDDVEVTLPNAVIANAKIVNESGGPYTKHRIRVGVGVSYGSDIDKVQSVLEDIASSNEKIADEPAARVRFRQFGASSLDFELLGWINNPQDRGLTKHELNRAIYKRFETEGITIPFPQRDLWIKEMPTDGQ